MVIPGQSHALPDCIGMVTNLLWGWQTLAFLARTSRSRIRWGALVQGCIHTQPSDDRHGIDQTRTSVQKFQGSISTIAHDNELLVRQPAAQLKDHLTRMVGNLFGFASLPFIVAFGGSQDGQERQRPNSSRPGNVCQPHQTYPAQAAGFDKVALAGAHRVSIDTPRCNLLSTSSLNRLINAKSQHAFSTHKRFQQQLQQDLPDFQARPLGATQHLMVLGIVSLSTQAHYPQYRTHRSFACSQNRANHQHFNLIPHTYPLYRWRKLTQYRHNPYRQIRHLQPFVVVRSKAYSASSFVLPMCKVQTSWSLNMGGYDVPQKSDSKIARRSVDNRKRYEKELQ